MHPDGRPWRIAALCFDHMHIGDQLRVVLDHPDAELVGVFDTEPERMRRVCADLGIAEELQHTDHERCLAAGPDVAVLCPTTGGHLDWTLRVAPYGVHVMVEKPFAHDLAAADAMIDVVTAHGRELAVNWPLAWVASHRTLRRLVAEGALGEIVELHHYGGNRGPLFHEHGKREIDAAAVREQMGDSWWYRRDQGGGSLLDYLGYGTTLGTWFLDGEAPLEVTTTAFVPEGLEVDTHSLVAARYRRGLSTFQTRWGTFTDPWTHQPQPRCGFVLSGTRGTATSSDYAATVHMQDDERPEGFDVPVDPIPAHERTAISYLLHCLEQGVPLDGPTGAPISRTGQRIVDAARLSAERNATVRLDELP